MRWWLSGAMALSILGYGRSSDACSFLPEVRSTHPQVMSVDVPVNAVLFVESSAPPFEDHVAVMRAGGETRQLRPSETVTSSFPYGLVMLELGPLPPTEHVAVEVTHTALSVSRGIDFFTSRDVDLRAPAAPAVTLTAACGPGDSCFDAGFYVTANMTPASDPSGIGAYIVYELQPNDALRPVFGMLGHGDFEPKGLSARFYAGAAEGTHCYIVRALDGAGNASTGRNATCIDLVRNPNPSIDAGIMDAVIGGEGPIFLERDRTSKARGAIGRARQGKFGSDPRRGARPRGGGAHGSSRVVRRRSIGLARSPEPP